MSRKLNIPNIISAKDAAMLSAYGDKSEEVLTKIFNDIAEAVNNKKNEIKFPKHLHSVGALRQYLGTFGYKVEEKYRPAIDEFVIVISWL